MKRIHFLLLLPLFLFALSCSKGGGETTPVPTTPTLPPEPVNLKIEQAFFTDPAVLAKGQKSNKIKDEILRYLDGAVKGSSVYVNIYLLDDDDIINRIVKIAGEGVNLQVMVDNSRQASQEQNAKAILKLQSSLKGGSRFVLINNDLVNNPTSGSINHHKHLLFSDVLLKEGRARYVVFSTSHNFTTTDPSKLQDAVILTDEGLYNAFVDNWNKLAARAGGGMKTFNYTVYKSADGAKTACFFPRQVNEKWDGEDTILEILNKISDFANTTVQVGMSDWVDSRMAVTSKLAELQTKGVKLEIVAKTSAGDETLKELAKIAQKGGYVKILQMPKENIHSKYLLINGTWEGTRQKIVVAGTHNFTTNALKYNNELVLILKNNSLFDAYQQNFQSIKNNF